MTRILAFLVVLAIGVAIAYQMVKPVPKLKIYSPSDVNPSLVDPTKQGITRMHRIAKFELIDQTGALTTNQNFEGKIYVADFFFTTCGSICPKMTTQMQRAYEYYKTYDEVMFLSHTVMPAIDTVEVMAEYGKKYGANPDKWKLLTGNKKHIYELARKSYFAVTDQGSGDEHDFIHTENFILVDKEKRIRGYYDGTSTEDVNRMIEEITILLKEYEAS